MALPSGSAAAAVAARAMWPATSGRTAAAVAPRPPSTGASLVSQRTKHGHGSFWGSPLGDADVGLALQMKAADGVALAPRCVMEPPSKQMTSLSFTVGPPMELSPSSPSSSSDSSSLGPSPSGRWQTVPDIWSTLAERCGDQTALQDPHRSPPRKLTYKELEESIQDFAEGLRVAGLQQGQCVSLFSDNSHRWLIADQGIMTVGAADAVRGLKSPLHELLHITIHSDSSGIVVENRDLLAQLAPRLRENANSLKFAVLLWGSCASNAEDDSSPAAQKTEAEQQAAKENLDLPFPIYTYAELLKAGHTSRLALAAADGSVGRSHQPHIRPDDIATLVYTSGTGGNPKAVMLTHANLLHQINTLDQVVRPEVGDMVLSLLPPWHMYERSCEYYLLTRGMRQVYSGVKFFKEDLSIFPPHYFVAVPLVFKILYEGVQKRLAESKTKKTVATFFLGMSEKYMDARRVMAGRDLASARRSEGHARAAADFLIASVTAAILLPLHLLAMKLVYSKIHAAIGIKKVAISGGGSLPPQVDKFFEAIGITLLVGYGLTETSPVLTARMPNNNILGSVGIPLPGTEVKVVHPTTNEVVPAGNQGIVKARGPQIMKGYYKNPTATAAAIDEEGWFDTGDLGWLAPHKAYGASRNCGGELVLTGRAKDTIVLSNGENVEPTHIEDAILQSPVVHQIMIVGQDQKRLGALIVPDKDQLQAAAKAVLAAKGVEAEPTKEQINDVVRSEVNRSLSVAGCTYTHERVGPFVLLDEPFSIDNMLLTPTMKMRRPIIAEKYQKEINSLYN